jgi:hypothetical protein
MFDVGKGKPFTPNFDSPFIRLSIVENIRSTIVRVILDYQKNY